MARLMRRKISIPVTKSDSHFGDWILHNEVLRKLICPLHHLDSLFVFILGPIS